MVRIATIQDMPEMIRLERRCPSAAHWSEKEYALLLAAEQGTLRLALVAEDVKQNSEGELPVLGFLVARNVVSEWELENIVVAPEVRGKGIATLLVEELLSRAKLSKSDQVFLEVRESNQAARSLYKKLGFQESGRRNAYYSNPLEDAVLYSRTLL